MLTMKNKLAELDASMNQIASLTTTLRGNQLLRDLISQTLLRSLQYGIVVMGVIGAFVYARNYRRHSTNNPGNVEDCMEGRIRLLTAITPACAHHANPFAAPV